MWLPTTRREGLWFHGPKGLGTGGPKHSGHKAGFPHSVLCWEQTWVTTVIPTPRDIRAEQADLPGLCRGLWPLAVRAPLLNSTAGASGEDRKPAGVSLETQNF